MAISRTNVNRIIFLLIISLLLIGTSGNASASSKDPINIEADNAKIIEKEGKSVYSGNVVLIQGTIRMTADSLTVYSVAGKLTQITALGKPVRYEEKGQSEDSDIAGEANLLEYYTRDNKILLLDNAKLTQGRTQFSGNRIEYNTSTDVVTAEVSDTGNERVKVTIEPDKLLGNTSETKK